MSFSILTVEGNLTNDAKIITNDRGDIAEITVAVNYRVRDEDQVGFFNVSFYDDRIVNFLKDYGRKGARIALLADIRQVRKDTTTFTNYIGKQILFLFNKRDNTNVDKLNPPKVANDHPPKVANKTTTDDSLDDDFPF